MKKSLIIFLLLLVGTVQALSLIPCSDEDGPKDLNDPVSAISHGAGASNKTHNVQDYCVHAKGGINVNYSEWVREWHCVDDVLTYTDFKCQDWGFEECYTANNEGFCRGYSSNPSPFENASYNLPYQLNESTCGDGRIEVPLEDCDPPGGFCRNTWGAEGACGFDCFCLGGADILIKSCGDGNVTGIEECEEDLDCLGTDDVCNNCGCVNASTLIVPTINLTNSTNTTAANTTNATAANTTAAKPSPITGASVAAPKAVTKLAEEVVETVAEEKTGVRITSGITHIPLSLFNWLWGLFT